MLVATLIGIMIAVVVGINLIPLVMETTEKVVEEGAVEPGSAVEGMISVLPYIFVAVIILGAVAWLGGMPGTDSDDKRGRREKVKAFFKNPREVILRIEESSRNWEKYINNLDELLGIKTIVTDETLTSLGLALDGKTLWISKEYDWYIADKDAYGDVFKVVGLHKKYASLNVVYILGADWNREPYLVQVPAKKYLEAPLKDCIRWTEVESEKVAV